MATASAAFTPRRKAVEQAAAAGTAAAARLAATLIKYSPGNVVILGSHSLQRPVQNLKVWGMWKISS